MAQQISSLEEIYLENTYLTIGSFDGVHLGHQKLISDLIEHAQSDGAKSAVLTFHPHPSVILRGRKDKFYLTTLPEKIQLIDDLGVDVIISYPFTFELSQYSAKDFIQLLHEHLRFRQLWVGEDFALGKGREGNVQYLTTLGREFNYQINVIKPIEAENKKISSSYIRNLLSEGHVEKASSLLGRPYQMSGEVVHGDGRGKGIGIPTANLETGDEKLIPGSGIYACLAHISGNFLPAAVNIGIRPTFESAEPKTHIEAHILDFSNDLYTQRISIDFLAWLRGEEKFDRVDELINQIHKDIDKTREITSLITKR
jgi:riboflavin kinase/FMN adenylyltransferase